MNANKRQMIEQHLAQTERHVTEGERLIEHQRTTIAERRRVGHDVKLAEQLLGEMECTQRLHVEDRDRLLRELRSTNRGA